MNEEPTTAADRDRPAPWAPLRPALVMSGMVQAVFVIFGAMAFDGGASLRVCLQGTAAYWIMVGWLAYRGKAPDGMDAALVRIGSVLWLAVAAVVEL